eukprot:5949825-Prorocentrum_lima.AAC.1
MLERSNSVRAQEPVTLMEKGEVQVLEAQTQFVEHELEEVKQTLKPLQVDRIVLKDTTHSELAPM